MTLRKRANENMVGKGKNASNKYFSPFPTMFSNFSKMEIIIWATFMLLTENGFSMEQSKILLFGKELNGMYIVLKIYK